MKRSHRIITVLITAGFIFPMGNMLFAEESDFGPDNESFELDTQPTNNLFAQNDAQADKSAEEPVTQAPVKKHKKAKKVGIKQHSTTKAKKSLRKTASRNKHKKGKKGVVKQPQEIQL